MPPGCGCFRAAAWETVLGCRHGSLRRLSEVCPSCFSLRVRILNLESYSLFASHLTVTFPVFWVCLWSTALDFSGNSSVTRAQLLVRQWIHVLHQYLAPLDELHTCSARILKCCSPFCRRTEKRAQSMLLVAVCFAHFALENWALLSRASRG